MNPNLENPEANSTDELIIPDEVQKWFDLLMIGVEKLDATGKEETARVQASGRWTKYPDIQNMITFLLNPDSRKAIETSEITPEIRDFLVASLPDLLSSYIAKAGREGGVQKVMENFLMSMDRNLILKLKVRVPINVIEREILELLKRPGQDSMYGHIYMTYFSSYSPIRK